MCGRYYVDDETAREIEKIVRQVNEKLNVKQGKKEIYPSAEATVLINKNNQLHTEKCKWGFPNFNKKGIIFNARSETALEKRMFRESILNRRCIIPAKGFYEWDSTKNKFDFQKKEEPVMYMAGFYKKYADENRFVILTTAANISVKDIHDRMPLILERDQIGHWLMHNGEFDYILNKVPAQLKRYGYEQASLLTLEENM